MTTAPHKDTIAAIATAPGEAAISVVRVSGPTALAVADLVFRSVPPPPSGRSAGTFVHGRVVDASGATLDDGLLLVFRAPHSYTGEDAVELQGHGGTVAARRVLAAVLAAGARSAGPGEFTQRAFLNGRLDLIQAEAVLDLIRARSDAAAAAAREQLDGVLSCAVNKLYDTAIAAAADLEATLDFVEGEIPDATFASFPERLQALQEQTRGLLAGWSEGRIRREGALVVIAGPPNAGKSTLFNRLLGTNRTIVHHEPGTTRDVVEENFVLAGMPIRLVDTAGLRMTDAEVESEGIRRARAQAACADILLFTVDARVGLTDTDRSQLLALRRPCCIIFNKSDLRHDSQTIGAEDTYQPAGSCRRDGDRVSTGEVPFLRRDGYPVVVEGSTYREIACSALTGEGIDTITSAVIDKLNVDPVRLPHASVSERHRNLLARADNEISQSMELCRISMDDAVMASAHLRTAIQCIGEITGRIYHDELLDAVFSRFCIGK